MNIKALKSTRRFSGTILVAWIFFVILFVFFTYTFLHESGHAILGLLFGQSLTEFKVNFWNFDAHVSMSGGALAPWQLAIQSSAGAILPFLIWMIFISFTPRKTNFSLEVLKLLSSMAVVNTLLAWIVLPILFHFGMGPSDDVTNFLRYSQISPSFLIFIATVIYAGGWALFLSKIDGFRDEFLLFNKNDSETLTAGMRSTVSVLTAIMMVCLFFVVMLNGFTLKHAPDKLAPPQGFAPVTQIDLSKRAYSAETLTEFSLEKSTYVGIFIIVDNINTTYFDLRLTGPRTYSSIVLHGEGYNAFQDGGLWEKQLAPGIYHLVITSHQSPGTASIYLKTR